MIYPDAYEEYKKYLISRGRSFSTFAALEYGFCGVAKFLPEESAGSLEAIQAQHVDAYVAQELGRGTKPQSINPKMSTLRRFFSWCLQRGYLTVNPLATWEPLRKVDTPPRRDFTRSEVEAVLRHEASPVDKLRWLFYFNTGRRAMEGVNLRWDWIDFGSHKIIIPADANKSSRPITIHLNDTLYRALAAHYKQNANVYGGLVFPPISGSGLLRKFKKAMIRAGVDSTLYCLHSTRHTAAMELYTRSGHNIEMVRKVLGHASIATTQKYLHVDDDEARKGMEALNYA